MENFGFLPLDLVKKNQNAVKNQSNGKNESLPPKATYGSNFQMPKKMYPRFNEPPASLCLAQVWQTPKQLGIQRLFRVFLSLQIGTSSVGTEFPWPKHRS